MTRSRQPVQPDWKEFLKLGEALLNQATANDQRKLIRRTIEKKLKAKAEVWFAEPFYPLPGEPRQATLPAQDAGQLVTECFQSRQPRWLVDNQVCHPQKNGATLQIAVPLSVQENLLGVLSVIRGQELPFSQDEIHWLDGICAHIALALQTFRQVVIKNWRFDQLELIRTVSGKITQLLNLDEFCQQVAALVRDTLQYYFVSIFTIEPGKSELRYRASAGQNFDDRQLAKESFLRLGSGIVGTVAQSGEEIIADDTAQSPFYTPYEELPHTRSEAAFPLKVGNRILGVLDIQNDQPHSLHEHDISVLRALADHLAIAVEGVELVIGLEKRASQISALLEISHALTSILEFEPLLGEVVSSIQRHFGYPYVHIFTLHPGRKKIFYEAGSGERSQAFEQHQVTYDLDDEIGIIPWVARNAKTLLVNDVDQEPLYRPSDLPPTNTRAELTIPLGYGGQVLGVLDLQSDQPDNFDPKDIPLLEALGSSIAIAMRNAKLYQSEVWRRQVADSFKEIAGLVSANTALEELLERILNELDRSLPCDATAIWLMEEYQGPDQFEFPRLHLAAAHGVDPNKISEVVSTNLDARAFLEKALDDNAPLIRKPEDPCGPLGVALEFPPDYSSIAVPLRAGDQSLGILSLAHRTSGRYGTEAGLITSTFANYAAVAIQNNRLFSAAQDQAWTSTILLQIAEATQANQTVEDLLETMARLTPLLVGIKKCAFFLWDEDRQVFILKSQYGLDLIAPTELTFDLSLPVVAELVSTREVVFIENAFLGMNLAEADIPAADSTLVILPLVARGRLLGAYLVAHQGNGGFHTNHAFDQQTLALLQGIAQQTAVALENLQLIEARQEEAYVTAVMLQVAQTVVNQKELGDILDTIVHLMPILVGIDTCVIYLWDSNQAAFRTANVFTGSQKEDLLLEGETFQPGEFPMLDAVRERDQLVACKVTETNFSVDDWTELTCLLSEDEIERHYTVDDEWILGVPLSVKGDVFGVLMAKEANVPANLHERRLEILTGVAQQVSLAIQNEHLNRDMVQQERLEREIQLARQIQKTFLPQRLPKIPGWELEIHWQTAREVGGDFYDVFKASKDRIGIVIADVSDKGMPAALYMTVARTLIRAFSQNSESPARTLDRVNRALVVDSQDGLFVTAVFAFLDTSTGKLIYANAGHNLPLLLRAADKSVEPLPKGGTALGIFSKSRLTDHEIDIHHGDSLVFFTDGVTESFSPQGEPFGDQRLQSLLKLAPSQEASALMEHLRRELSAFRQGAPPSDDMTLVLIHRGGINLSLIHI